ncbi:hypothetical protein [Demequina sediminicola]|uniref:hypothetical protein n=1 Tax=Demequina sediminicola TaxID=1095026 RepID=UPI000782A639|nr:hypothetical protein [Demequina sediminicola]
MGVVWGVPVPEVPPAVQEPDFTWPEVVVLMLVIVAVWMFVAPLARAMWPWSKPREVSVAQGRRWLIAFVAIPVLMLMAWLVDGAGNRYYEGLREERDAEIEAIAAPVLDELEGEYGLTATEETERTFWRVVFWADAFAETREYTFVEPSGDEVLCAVTVSSFDEGREASMQCPAPTEPGT